MHAALMERYAWRSYVSLRILGMDADHEVAQKARRWVRTLRTLLLLLRLPY